MSTPFDKMPDYPDIPGAPRQQAPATPAAAPSPPEETPSMPPLSKPDFSFLGGKADLAAMPNTEVRRGGDRRLDVMSARNPYFSSPQAPMALTLPEDVKLSAEQIGRLFNRAAADPVVAEKVMQAVMNGLTPGVVALIKEIVQEAF